MSGTAAVLAAASAMAGCSSTGTKSSTVSTSPSSTVTTAAATAPAVVAISPAGVTTKINVPSYSTEEEYFQACHAAKTWMHGHPGDRAGLVERYLAAVQTPGVVGAGTWNTAWTALPLPRQAGVIVAARAAANDECG
ncbi:MAG TPA: lipoprotein LpqV [Mycobacterium sp.]|nr:lipoprotein LpqV [Mycobacterium sp.]